VACRHVSLRPAFAPPQRDEQFGQEVSIQAGKVPSLHDDGTVGLPGSMQIEQIPRGTGKSIGNDRCLAPQPRDRRDCRRIGSADAPRKNVVPQEVPRPRGVGIGGILAPLLDSKPQKRAAHRARDTEKRPRERHAVSESANPPHACESSDAGTAQSSVKNRLGLVIHRVRHEHVSRANLVGDLGKKRVSQPPSPSLQPLPRRLIAALAYRQAAPHTAEAESRSEPDDEFTVFGGLWSHVVLGMGDHEVRNSELREADEHRHTVGPPRDGHDDRKTTLAPGWQRIGKRLDKRVTDRWPWQAG
jgi:hypothetical protein